MFKNSECVTNQKMLKKFHSKKFVNFGLSKHYDDQILKLCFENYRYNVQNFKTRQLYINVFLDGEKF